MRTITTYLDYMVGRPNMNPVFEHNMNAWIQSNYPMIDYGNNDEYIVDRGGNEISVVFVKREIMDDFKKEMINKGTPIEEMEDLPLMESFCNFIINYNG